MDPANYGGVKGKLPSSVLYGEVTEQIQVESNDRSKQDMHKLSPVYAFISRKLPKRAEKRETRRAAMKKRRRKLGKLIVMAIQMRWRS